MKNYTHITIENIGWSNPKNPSWFPYTAGGRDMVFWASYNEAIEEARKLEKETNIKHRVTIKQIHETNYGTSI